MFFAFLPGGIDRSGTVGTTSTQLAPANTARKTLNIQNVHPSQNLGINEFGGVAAIATPGTYILVPGASLNVRTNQLINIVGSGAGTTFTATEV